MRAAYLGFNPKVEGEATLALCFVIEKENIPKIKYNAIRKGLILSFEGEQRVIIHFYEKHYYKCVVEKYLEAFISELCEMFNIQSLNII